MRKRQVIVVGAGVGGASAGFWCKRHGLDVLMLEKEQFPRDKPCGDGQVSGMYYLLEDMGIAEEVEKNAYLSKGSAYGDDRGKMVYLDVPPGIKYFVTPRYKFDDIVNKAAVREGCDYIENFEVTEVLTRSGKACGVRGIHNGKVVEIESDLVILASGSHSMPGRQMGFMDENPENVFYGLRGYFKGVEGMRGHAEIHYPLPELLPGGYTWSFDLGNGVANIGVYVSEKALQATGKTTEELLWKWRDTTELGWLRLGHAELIGELKGWRLPTGKRLPVVGEGCLAVGDTGNMIDPLYGGGTPHAMASGRMAAEVAAKAVEANDFSAEFLHIYEDMIDADFGKGYAYQLKEREEIFNNIDNIHDFLDYLLDKINNEGWHGRQAMVSYIKDVKGWDQPPAGTFSK